MRAKRHIVVIGRILALLLFVANSGFTLAFHACSMSTMACCADPMPAQKAPASPASESHAALAAPQMQCCAVIVAGGTNAAPVAPEYSSTQHSQISKVRAELPALSAFAGPQASASPRLSLLSSRSAIAPPAVEKHVLNAVFLI